MKAVKVLLILVALLIAVVVAGGLMIAPKFSVTRSISIAAAPDKIYPLIADPRAWKQWSAWNQRDPAMAIDYSGPASGAARSSASPATTTPPSAPCRRRACVP